MQHEYLKKLLPEHYFLTNDKKAILIKVLNK